MNVRITPSKPPNRTYLYYGVVGPLRSDGHTLHLEVNGYVMPDARPFFHLRLADIAEIALDEEPGDFF
jgi:hypothetical protein